MLAASFSRKYAENTLLYKWASHIYLTVSAIFYSITLFTICKLQYKLTALPPLAQSVTSQYLKYTGSKTAHSLTKPR